MKWVRSKLALGIGTAVVAILLLLTGLAPADAGVTYFHDPTEWLVPEETIPASGWAGAFRSADEATSSPALGDDIGWIHDGDWNSYDIYSTGDRGTSTTYNVAIRVASDTDGGTINFDVNGVHVGSAEVIGTGGWENWTTVYTTVEIEHPATRMQLTFNGSEGRLFEIDWLEFEEQPQLPQISTPIPMADSVVTETVQAESFINQRGVKAESTSDIGGGENIGWIQDGDWSEYSLDLGDTPDSSGIYSVAVRVASKTDGGTINMSVDGVDIGSVEVDGTGGWQNWTTVYTTVELDDGTGTLRLTYSGDRGSLLNVNWLEFVSEAS